MVLIRKIVRAKNPCSQTSHSGKSSITPDERLHQKLKFCYFPISFCILCKTFELVAKPFCILSWNPDVDLPFALNITKCTSNEWCQLEKSCALKTRAVRRAIQEELTNPRRTTGSFVTSLSISAFVQNFCTRCEALMYFVLEEK